MQAPQNLPQVTGPNPHDASIEEVNPPDAPNRTFWTSAAGVVAAIAGGCTALAGVISVEPWKTRELLAGGVLLIASQVLSNIGSVFAGKKGVASAARALEKARGQR